MYACARVCVRCVQIFFPLGITKLSLGADYNPLENSWRMHTSWRDQIVGAYIVHPNLTCENVFLANALLGEIRL